MHVGEFVLVQPYCFLHACGLISACPVHSLVFLLAFMLVCEYMYICACWCVLAHLWLHSFCCVYLSLCVAYGCQCVFTCLCKSSNACTYVSVKEFFYACVYLCVRPCWCMRIGSSMCIGAYVLVLHEYC